MRFQASQVGLALTLAALHTADATTCKTLSDPSSTFLKSVAAQYEIDPSSIPVDTIFPEIDEYFQWLSKCVAAVDPVAVYASLAASNSLNTCLSTIGEFDLDLSTSVGWSNACPMLNDTIIPCIDAAMTEVIMDTFDSTGTCCDDFLSEIKTMFGDSLEDMVKKLVKLGANVACSKRTFTNLKKAVKTEVCGYSIFNSFTFIESDEDASSLINLAQIPNNQMCKAFAGESFTNTKSGTVTIGFGTNNADSVGVCLQPVDELIQYIASWPIFSKTLNADGTSISLSSLFASDKSLRGNLLLAYAKTSTNMPMIFLRALDKFYVAMGSDDSETSGSWENSEDSQSSTMNVDDFSDFLDSINSYATSLLLHIPNNGGCTFEGQTITEVYDTNTNTSTIATVESSASKLPMFGAIGGALLWSVVLVVLL